MKVTITIQPVIYSDEYLNRASLAQGQCTYTMQGDTEQQLFENIRERIYLSGGETVIHDKEIARKYNSWVSDRWRSKGVPAEITNMGQRDMRYALPYSQQFKLWLHKHN